MSIFAADIDCPHCQKSIHFDDANAVIGDDLKCPECGEGIEMESDSDGEGNLSFWLRKVK